MVRKDPLFTHYNSTEGKRFVGEETDSWLLLEDFVPEMDSNIHGDRSSHWTMNRYRMQRRHNFLCTAIVTDIRKYKEGFI